MSFSLESNMRYGVTEETVRRTISETDAMVEEGEVSLFPLIEVDDMVLFPHHSLPIASIEDLSLVHRRKAMKGQPVYIVVLSKTESDPSERRVGEIATLGVIRSTLKLPTGHFGAIVEGLERVSIRKVRARRSGYTAQVTGLRKTSQKSTEILATAKALKVAIHRFIEKSEGLSRDSKSVLLNTPDLEKTCDLIIPYLSLSSTEQLRLLKEKKLGKRLQIVLSHIRREIDLEKLSERIQTTVKDDLMESQRRTYLLEQMRAIRRELGEGDDSQEEIDEIRSFIESLNLKKEARDTVNEELDRMSVMPPGSPEYLVSHNYVSLIKDLPWGLEPADIKFPSFRRAETILNNSHYGLNDVKESILEYLAVVTHRGNTKGQTLLLQGPPGVGKTSLASAIASALNRPFVRVSLGGVKDEAEIRGHRRTYIGSMPGKIIQAIKQTKSQAPVILLDEIDKIGDDGRGSVESAMLEVLDPSQNANFVDHYLSVPYDLSNVMFLATANTLETLSQPLLDRMEIIEIPSYTEEEKLNIATHYLIPKIREELKLKAKDFCLPPGRIRLLIRNYTRESGVRELNRLLNTIARKIIKKILSTKRPVRTIEVEKLLGPMKYVDEPKDKKLPPGVSVGLAYTSVGGEILYIETTKSNFPGMSGRLKLTGQLGKVMQESAEAALSSLTSRKDLLGIEPKIIEESQIHLHLPDGATPKDGPSAGVAIFLALSSLFAKRPLPNDLAMTGEITLRGQVLPVGGIREKVLAAHRYKKKKILIPKTNLSDLAKIPKDVLKSLEIIPIETIDDALQAAELLH